MDYNEILDGEMRAFIDETLSFYPDDLEPGDWSAQRAVYDRMAAHFHAGRPQGLSIADRTVSGVPVRIYGPASDTVIVYAHGGGFVLGGLESHDDVCAEIAAETAARVVSVDYRLVPEHPHPAAYDDVLSVVRELAHDHRIVLCGDSAGAMIMGSIAGTWSAPALLGQVLIYPDLGYKPEGGSYETHAYAPLLSREECLSYGDLRHGPTDDPTANPSRGNLAELPPTWLFPAECDPLHDDCLRYRDQARMAGREVEVRTGQGLVHGWLRARHRSARAREEFAVICDRLRRAI